MKSLRLAIGLFAAMALLVGTASVAAAPYAAGKGYDQRHSHKHQHRHQQHRYPPQQHRSQQGQSQWLWQNQREMHRSPPPRVHQHPHEHRPSHHPRPPHHRGPPHRDQMRRDINRSSHYLRPGPPLPRHMHLVVGRPLPHGWHHRVPPGQLKHLPQYPGYEWHSAGRDLVLVAVTTGLVYTILDNVLN